MAVFTPQKPPKPIFIDKWLGVNESVSETGLKLGEATRQVNFRITKDYHPQKRPGHSTYWNYGNTKAIQGMWKGSLGGVDVLISCNNGHVWRDYTISGTIYDALDTATYTNVDVVKTTALPGSEAGSVAIDGVVLLKNSAGTQLVEVALSDVDDVESVGKFYFDADEKINYILAKDEYATIAAAREGIGTTTANYRIGTITDAKTCMIYFESKLLFFNGTDYKEYNGTTFQDVAPYVPTTYVGLSPTLAGLSNDNINEPSNLLTGEKKNEYQGNGTDTEYTLIEIGIDSALVTCTIDRVTKTELTHFTVNRTTGKVNFAAGTTPHGAPANGSLVILGHTKVVSGNADLIKKNRFAMTFGPGNDTAIFLWGNKDFGNRRSWSATLNSGYFPTTNYTHIGTNEFAITDIKAVYNRQIIFKEDRTHYSPPEYVTLTNMYDYPVYDLNERIGNIVFGGVQILDNAPLSIDGNSWYMWSGTAIEDERNASVISDRIKESLSKANLSTAVTMDYETEKEYWCNVGSMVYIYNYGNNTMYMYDNISATCFLEIDNVVYYGSSGKIERFDRVDDNTIAVVAQLETGFNNFGSPQLIKNTDMVWVSIKPEDKTSLNIYFKTNKVNNYKPLNKRIRYRLHSFTNVDFSDFSFSTNRNTQTFSRRLRAKNYTSIQFMFENKERAESCIIIDFLVKSETQSEV